MKMLIFFGNYGVSKTTPSAYLPPPPPPRDPDLCRDLRLGTIGLESAPSPLRWILFKRRQRITGHWWNDTDHSKGRRPAA